jgi:riboflavin kinase, archaea type
MGGHAHWMTLHADTYEAKTGVRLVAGTLNVVLGQPWLVPQAAWVRLEPPEYGVPLSIVPCKIEGIDAFVIRTDKNNSGLGDHPATVVEVAARIHLRETLGLRDGDEVSLILPS